MKSTTDNNAKQRSRVRMQHNIVSFCCLLCVAFAVGWIIHSAGKKTEFFTFLSDSSQVRNDGSSADGSSQIQDDSAAALTDSSLSANDSSSQEPGPYEFMPPDAHPYSVAKDVNDELDDALFIGDSRTVGLFNNCDRPKATFYCGIGLNIQTAFETPAIKLDNGNMGTITDALAQGHQYGRVYINFGTNEMGWPYYDSFINYYSQLVQSIRTYSPNAKIYCESILPVTASREMQGDAINNTNVKALNEYIQQFANSNGCIYLPCDTAVMGEDGKLPEEASNDGVHLTLNYYKYWLNYIIDET